MRINSLTLYKTPLDSEYKNVYDDYESTDDYIEFLNDNFQHINIVLEQSPKSRKDVNGNFSVVIPYYDSMELHDYNYMVFDIGVKAPEYKFAFIISVGSINDGEGLSNRSCIIECKLDVWSNSYGEIKSNYKANIFKERSCTFDGNENKFIYDKSFLPSAYVTEKTEYASQLLRTLINVEQQYSNLRVLWARVRVSPSKYYFNRTTQTAHNTGDDHTLLPGAYPDEFGTIIAPIGIMIDNIPLSGLATYEIKISSQLGSGTYSKVIQKDAFPHLIMNLFGSYIFDVEYTYFPPFRYSVEEGLNQYNQLSFHIKPYGSGVGSIDVIEYKTSADGDNYQQIIYGFSNTNPLSSISPASRYSKYLYRYQIDYDYARQESLDTVDVFKTMNALRFPFYRTVIFWNGKSIVLNNSSDLDFIINVDLQGAVHPSFYLSTYATRNDYHVRNSTSSTGTVTTMVNTLSDFLTKQRNSIMQQQIMGGLGIARNLISFGASSALAFSGNPAGIVGMGASAYGIAQSANQMATPIVRQKDLENYPETITIPNSYADDDMFAQDDIMICYQKGIQWDEPFVKEHLFDLHKNGSRIPLFLTPTSCRRDVFDFDAFEDCNIIGVYNADDTDELNKAFTRGVRRWHLTGDNDYGDVERVKILRVLNANIVNIERSLL